MPSLNETCRNIIETYAIDVAQIERNIAIVNALRSARSAVLGTDIDPSCITLVDWIICYFRFPPCKFDKLLLPCANTCGELIRFLLICYDPIREHIDDPTVLEHFKSYGCRLPESYYEGYARLYFITAPTPCITLPTG